MNLQKNRKKVKTESSNESFLRAKELFGDLVEIR